MAIKMNAQSKTLLTVLLVGSLCGLNASDLNEEGSRLQITGAYELLSAEIAAVSTSAQSTAIQGTGYDASTDSLVNISNNTTSVPLATNAQAVDVLQGSTASGTVIVGGTTYTADTNDLTSVSRAISAVEGEDFIAGASLIANAQRTAANQVVAIANAGVLTVSTIAYTTGTFVPVYQAITDALTGTTTQVEITAILTALTTLGAATATIGDYSVAMANAALAQLTAAVNNWDALIS